MRYQYIRLIQCKFLTNKHKARCQLPMCILSIAFLLEVLYQLSMPINRSTGIGNIEKLKTEGWKNTSYQRTLETFYSAPIEVVI